MKLEKLTEEFSREAANYFGLDKYDNIKPFIFASMESLALEFEKYTGKTAPSWLKGFSPDGERWEEIWLIGPDVITDKGVPMGEKKFRTCLKHEILHTYQKIYAKQNRIENKNVPVWLREGMAICFADEKFPEPGDLTIEKLKNVEGLGSEKFKIGYKLVSEILNKHGKEELLKLYLSKNQKEFYTRLKRMFDWLK